MSGPGRSLRTTAILLLAAGCLASGAERSRAQSADPPALELEAKIALGAVRGRIDHMAVDLDRRRIFVAELGDDSLGVVDLEGRKLLTKIGGLKEPQGIGYLPSTALLYAANGGDGSVRLIQSSDFSEKGRVQLGDDADNVRVNHAANRIIVGYGSGGLAVLDPVSGSRLADVALAAHPEGFQLDARTNRIFVNLPKAHAIAVVDQSAGKQVASWRMTAGDNFPMALDPEAQRVLVMFRRPAKLSAFAMQDGRPIATVDACGDADDLFTDAKRHRIYVSCGEGVVDVFDAQSYRRMARIPTVAGARTSLFVPELDRLLVAVRAVGHEPAALWAFRPSP